MAARGHHSLPSARAGELPGQVYVRMAQGQAGSNRLTLNLSPRRRQDDGTLLIEEFGQMLDHDALALLKGREHD